MDQSKSHEGAVEHDAPGEQVSDQADGATAEPGGEQPATESNDQPAAQDDPADQF